MGGGGGGMDNSCTSNGQRLKQSGENSKLSDLKIIPLVICIQQKSRAYQDMGFKINGTGTNLVLHWIESANAGDTGGITVHRKIHMLQNKKRSP